jgi:uncharacterized protein (UPF0548 family)
VIDDERTDMSDLTYAEVGATRYEPLPAGYHYMRRRTLLGSGEETFRRAAEAVVTFEMHRSAGVRVDTDADRAAPGVRLTVKLGPFTVPCEVVYTLDEENRAGFGYGTRPGHQERGEEAFLVERDADGRVWLRIVAFSRPARWPAILGGPVALLVQRGFTAILGRALRRLCDQSRTVTS